MLFNIDINVVMTHNSTLISILNNINLEKKLSSRGGGGGSGHDEVIFCSEGGVES